MWFRCAFIQCNLICRVFIWFDIIHHDVTYMKGRRRWLSNIYYMSRNGLRNEPFGCLSSSGGGWSEVEYEELGTWIKLYRRVREIIWHYIWFDTMCISWMRSPISRIVDASVIILIRQLPLNYTWYLLIVWLILLLLRLRWYDGSSII